MKWYYAKNLVILFSFYMSLFCNLFLTCFAHPDFWADEIKRKIQKKINKGNYQAGLYCVCKYKFMVNDIMKIQKPDLQFD